MRRRDFIFAVGTTLALWLTGVRAQSDRPRRIGILMNRAADDKEGQAGVAAFQQALEQFGWKAGPDFAIDVRWGADDVALENKYAAELVGLAPNIVLASGTMSVAAVQNVDHA